MNIEKNQLVKDFEKEIWLYLDKDLPENRLKYWNEKISQNQSLENLLNEYHDLSEKYNRITNFEINNDKLNSIIEKATEKTSITNRIKDLFNKSLNSEKDIAFGKIAFASMLIVIAVLISIFSNKMNPIKKFTNNVNAELLDWNGDYIEKKIAKVGNMLRVASDEDYKKYSKYKLLPKDVKKNITLIDYNINVLKQEINNSEL